MGARPHCRPHRIRCNSTSENPQNNGPGFGRALFSEVLSAVPTAAFSQHADACGERTSAARLAAFPVSVDADFTVDEVPVTCSRSTDRGKAECSLARPSPKRTGHHLCPAHLANIRRSYTGLAQTTRRPVLERLPDLPGWVSAHQRPRYSARGHLLLPNNYIRAVAQLPVAAGRRI